MKREIKIIGQDAAVSDEELVIALCQKCGCQRLMQEKALGSSQLVCSVCRAEYVPLSGESAEGE